MDNNQLFWATGIDNSKLESGVASAIALFTKLSTQVNSELSKINNSWDKMFDKSKVKFDNPVDPAMISSIKSQIADLAKTIDLEVGKLGQFTSTYSQSMDKINAASAKLGKGVPANSPLQGVVTSVKADVSSADKELSFLERRFNYAVGSMIAYGSINFFKGVIGDIIKTSGEFSQMQTAIDAFVGSAAQGKQVFTDLMALAVKSPFEIKDITQSARGLLAFGDSAEKVVGDVKMMSDVAAGSGAQIENISAIYGKSMTEQRLYARNLLQLANSGVPIYEVLAKTMKNFDGTVGMSTEQVRKLVTAGKVGFPELQVAMETLTSAGGKFYGMSDKLAETTYGKISNLKDKWTLALKDMGDSQAGIINTGIDATTYLIANWETLAKTIAVAAEAVGTYQVAKMLVGVSGGIKDDASNLAETNSLATLISAEKAESLSKQGLVAGSVEYQAAIRAEILAMEQKAAVAVSNAEIEVASSKELLATKEIDLMLAKEKLDTAEKDGIITSISTARKNLNTAATDRDNVAKALNTAETNLNTAATEKNDIAIGIDTAAKKRDETGTNLLALAKAKLTAITATLNKTIAANPYIAVGVALAGLVAIMWTLYDSSTAAEKAQKSLAKSLKDLQDVIDAKQKAFNDLLNIAMSTTAGNVASQEAFAKLKIGYGDIIKVSSLAELRTQNSTKLQSVYNDELEKTTKLQGLKLIQAQKEQQLEAAKKDASNPTTTSTQYGTITIKSSKVDIDQATKELAIAKKNVNDEVVAINKVKADAAKPIVFDKTYWTGIRDSALSVLNQMDVRIKTPLDLGNFKGIDQKIIDSYNQANADIAKANEALTHFPDTKQSKASDKAREQENTEALARKKRLEDIQKDNEKLADIKSQAEINASQAAIDAMDEGFLKQQAIQKNNFEKSLLKLKEQKDKMLEIENDIAQKQFLNDNPNWKKTGAKAPAIITSLNPDDQKTYNLLSDSVQKEADDKSAKLLNDKLIEYNDYSAKKLKIEKDFDADIAALEASRTLRNSSEISSAITQAKVNKAKALMTLSFDQFKSTPEFSLAFEDLGNVSTATLEHLMAELKKYGATAAGTMKLADFKEYSKTQQAIFDQLVINDPFKALKVSVDELRESEEKLQKSQADLATIQGGGKVITGYKPTNNWDNANSIFPTEQVFGKQSTLLPSIGTDSNEIPKAIPIYLKLGDAVQTVKDDQNDLKKSTKDVEKAQLESAKVIGTLGSSFKDLGKAIGGETGNILSGIGDITSYVSKIITTVAPLIASITASGVASQAVITTTTTSANGAITTTAVTATTAMTAMQTATVVLEVIALAIMAIIVAVNLFKSKGDETYSSLKKSAESYISTLDTVISKEKAAMAALNSESAVAEGDLIIANIKKQIESYRELAESAGGAGAGMFSHSNAYKTNKNLSSYWSSISNSAGENITGIQDLYSLTPEQLSNIRENNQVAWSLINSDIQGYLNKIIDAGTSIDDTIKANNEALTATNFDTVKSGLDDLIKSSDTTMESVSNNFEDYMRTAMLNVVKDKYLNSALTQWYSDFATAMSDNTLSSDEAAKLKAEYESAYSTAQTTYDNMLTAAGVSATDATAANSTASAIKSMDQPTADILTAQFSASRIHLSNMDINISKMGVNISDLLLSLQGQASLLQLAFSDISKIELNTRDLADIKSTLSDIKLYGIKML